MKMRLKTDFNLHKEGHCFGSLKRNSARWASRFDAEGSGKNMNTHDSTESDLNAEMDINVFVFPYCLVL